MKSQTFEIEGGHAISGTIRPSGNKNAALPLLAACLLTSDEVVLKNVPDIRDVEAMLGILRDLGVTVTKHGGGVVSLKADRVNGHEPDPAKCRSIRASILLAGPMLARRGFVALPPPGGDVIGRRRIDTHVLALEALGATVTATPDMFRFQAKKRLKGADVFLDEASVTGTENAVMAAALAEGETILNNAACEPHVQDLCHLINAMGGKIEGIGTNRLKIRGVSRLHGAEFTLGPDYIEVGSFIVLAAVTGGQLRLVGARPEEHRATKLAFQKIGIEFHADETGKDIIVPAGQHLEPATDLGGAIPK